MPHRSRVQSAALLLSLCGLLSCSGGDSGASRDAMDAIAQRGRLIAGTEAAFEPFEYVENGAIVGYGRDVLDHVAAGLGVPLEQLNLPFQGLLPGLLARKFDVVATSVSINEARARRYAFTRPLGSSANTVVVRAGDQRVRSTDDLSGLVVGTQLASSVQPVVEEHDAQLQARGLPGYRDLKLFTAFPETYVALAAEQVDAIVIPSSSAALLMRRSPGRYVSVGTLGLVTYLAWVTRPEDLRLRDFINSRIDDLRASGKLRELQIKWFGAEMDTPSHGYLPQGAR